MNFFVVVVVGKYIQMQQNIKLVILAVYSKIFNIMEESSDIQI